MEGKIEGRIEGMIEGRIVGRIEGETTGERKGLLKAIQLNLTMKFGTEALPFMTLIEQIKETERLQMVMEQIFKAGSIDEVSALL